MALTLTRGRKPAPTVPAQATVKTEAAQKDPIQILREAGIDLNEAHTLLRAAKRDETMRRQQELAERKESNREMVEKLAAEVQAFLKEKGADFLPGTVLNWTLRVDKGNGEVVATANECHASGFIESIHVDPKGTILTGQEGAEAAKNVRPRRSLAA